MSQFGTTIQYTPCMLIVASNSVVPNQSLQWCLGVLLANKCILDSILRERIQLEWRQPNLANELRQCRVADSANVQHPVMIHCALTLTSPHTNGCVVARLARTESMGAQLVGV